MVPHPFVPSVVELHHGRGWRVTHNTYKSTVTRTSGLINEHQWCKIMLSLMRVCMCMLVCVKWLLPYAEVCRRQRTSCCLCSLYPAFLLEKKHRAHLWCAAKRKSSKRASWILFALEVTGKDMRQWTGRPRVIVCWWRVAYIHEEFVSPQSWNDKLHRFQALSLKLAAVSTVTEMVNSVSEQSRGWQKLLHFHSIFTSW